MARFIITIIPHPIEDGKLTQEANEKAVSCSHRESRAINKARRIRAAGNQDVMLFRVDSKRGLLPISLKFKEYVEGRHSRETGFNTIRVGVPFEGKEYISLSGRSYQLSQLADKVRG
jgi:hypothetical protein